jgi:hypothetical protein
MAENASEIQALLTLRHYTKLSEVSQPCDQPPKKKNVAGQMLLLIIILVDVGLIILGWYIYQQRQARYDATGIDISKIPDPRLEIPIPVAPVKKGPKSFEPFIIKDKGGPGLAVGAPLPAGHRPGGSPSGKGSSDTAKQVSRAVKFYYALKKDPRFKGNTAIQEWKTEFLSYPDLKAVNDRYAKDGDPVRFMVGMLRSPNFKSMVAKYFAREEIQSFVGAMTSSPDVMNSAPAFMKEPEVESAAKSLRLAPQQGSAAPPAKGSTQAIERMRENPELKKLLEVGESPGAVRLRQDPK